MDYLENFFDSAIIISLFTIIPILKWFLEKIMPVLKDLHYISIKMRYFLGARISIGLWEFYILSSSLLILIACALHNLFFEFEKKQAIENGVKPWYGSHNFYMIYENLPFTYIVITLLIVIVFRKIESIFISSILLLILSIGYYSACLEFGSFVSVIKSSWWSLKHYNQWWFLIYLLPSLIPSLFYTIIVQMILINTRKSPHTTKNYCGAKLQNRGSCKRVVARKGERCYQHRT